MHIALICSTPLTVRLHNHRASLLVDLVALPGP